mgnify:CR=1 FL=1
MPQKAVVIAFFVNRCVLATSDALKAPGRPRSMPMASIVRGKAKMCFIDAMLTCVRSISNCFRPVEF